MVKLNQLIERLCDADVDFVIVGGFADMLHGSTLVTRGLGVCTVLSSENIAKLRETLRDLQPKHRFTTQKFSFLDNPEPGVALNNLYLETDLGPVDLPGNVKGLGEFEAVRAASIEFELFGRRCRVLSVDGLIRAKEAMGRDKDMIAVKELRAIQDAQARSQLDINQYFALSPPAPSSS